MSDISYGVPVAARTGILGFLAEAVASLADRRLIAPAAILVVLLSAVSIVLARTVPTRDVPFPPTLIVATAASLLGLLVVSVAVLRIMGGSPRNSWRPDGALLLFGATILFGFGVGEGVRWILGDGDPLRALAAGALVNIATSPFAPWFAAIAIERPLAWEASRWVRSFRSWLLPYLLWSLLLLLPMGQLAAAMVSRIVAGPEPSPWPLALAEGPLSALLILLGLAFAATAYRHVARA
jgi:hypothetical protein